MDKAAIKTFAINSRRKLMEDVEYRMSLVGITKEGIQDSISDAKGIQTFDIGGSTYSIYDEDIKKRENLVKEVNNKGFENVVEEVAYTWFNRIIAIRYMEVNDYLPTKTRVLSSETLGKTEPDIITNAFDLDLDYTDDDRQEIFKLKDENKLDELFRFLFIKQCNKLNEILPGLFEKTEDFMELLINISFISEDGVIRNLVDTIPEDDFTNQVEIIGWMYQYYNSELKDETFKTIKKNKVPKERIPAVTQLFTPDWIVKYMVENSLGRLWIENHPNNELKSYWKYYLDDFKQNDDVKEKLEHVINNSRNVNLEQIKVIDPCMGSGHILVYFFDVLMQIYVSEGYTEKDAAIFILENNIYGLDIDDRAYQLSYFAVMMKARSYNRNIFSKNISPLLCSIQESNIISKELVDLIINEDPSIKNDLEYIIKNFRNAKEYGSILDVKDCDFSNINDALENISKKIYSDVRLLNYKNEINFLKIILKQSIILNNQYDVVVTNPPYMGGRNMGNTLKKYLNSNYPNSKADLFAVFIEKCNNFSKEDGFVGMITQQSFMFLATYEKLRKQILKNLFINLVHLGAHAFEEIGGEVVQATSFVFRKTPIENYISTFTRLIDYKNFELKEKEFFNDKNRFFISLNSIKDIPRFPIAYWVDENILESFSNGKQLNSFSDIKQGLATTNNDLFLRRWYEVDINNCGFNISSNEESVRSGLKWFPHNKGGSFRRWYGNQEFIINYKNDGEDLIKYKESKISNREYNFKKSLSWSRISTSNISFRYFSDGFLFDSAACSIFLDSDKNYNYILGLLNSNITQYLLSFFAPTLNYQVGDIELIPIIFKEEDLVDEIVSENICIVKNDWDDYENSWNFKSHPLLKFNNNLIENNFKLWEEYKESQYNHLKSNEIKLNELFSEIYQVSFDSNIEDKYISVTKADFEKDIKSFISYSIGCMLGRYSLDNEGLQFAGGEFNINNYSKFIPDDDNIIPVLDTEYFEDDIVGRFIEFVKVCFGDETLEENLEFIASALSKTNKPSREIIRDYLLKNFFNDHIKTYGKCPIYWMFSSGKENGFNCLVYMHRYEPGLVSRVRTDYLFKTQKAIELNIANCDNIINNSNVASEISKATKEKNKLIKQLEETREYDEALAYIANQNIEIDLDDGVKVNYAKFQNVEVSKEGQSTKKIDLLKKI